MTIAHVSLEVEQYESRGLRRKRMALTLDFDDWPQAGRRPRLMRDSRRATLAVIPDLESADEFEAAVATLEDAGYGRDRARHLIAIRMKFAEEEVARLREAAS